MSDRDLKFEEGLDWRGSLEHMIERMPVELGDDAEKLLWLASEILCLSTVEDKGVQDVMKAQIYAAAALNRSTQQRQADQEIAAPERPNDAIGVAKR